VIIRAAYKGDVDIGGGLKVSVYISPSTILDVYMMKTRGVETTNGTGSDEQDMDGSNPFN
jgi:hypothetical protein